MPAVRLTPPAGSPAAAPPGNRWRLLATAATILLVLAMAQLSTGATAASAATWQPKTPPLSTPWTSQVNPGNALPDYPRPQLARADWQNLNGEWQFAGASAGQAPPIGQNLGEAVLVPYPIESALSGIQRHEDHMFYRRTFTVPSGWNGRRVQLNFGAVDYQATVWVNGTQVGAHTGGYDHFTFDVTDQLHPASQGGGTNELIVGVTDTTNTGDQPVGKQHPNPSGIWYTAASGIWQTVWLEPTASAHVTRLDLNPNVPGSSLGITAQAANAGGLTVHAVARTGGTVVGEASGSPGSAFSVPVPNPRLWSPDDPFLYDLDVTVEQNGTVLDRVTSYFGMRSVGKAVVGGVLRPVLNGRFVFNMGTLDQGYWPDGIYTAPTDDALKFDLQAHKDLGYNTVRKHIKVEPDRWFYWADRLGLMVWQDMPASFGNDTTGERTQFESEWRQIIDEHRSSPSIVQWVVFNEGWGQYDTTRLTNDTKAYDPTRNVDNASGWNDDGSGDVKDVHVYVGPGGDPPSGSRYAVVGEFGGLGLIVPGHEWQPGAGFSYENQADSAALTNRYVGLIGAVKANMTGTGISGAIYTEITDVENERNGMWTYDRQVLKVDGPAVRAAHDSLLAAADALNNGGGGGPTGSDAHWKLDEGTGTLAADSAGSNNATLQGGAGWTGGKYGSALALDGNDDHAATTTPVVDTTGSYTVSAWANLSRTDGYKTVLSQDGNQGSGFYLQYSLADNRWAFATLNGDTGNATASRALSANPPALNTWVHLTGVRDAAAGQLRLYVNGDLEGTAPTNGNWQAGGPTAIGRGKWAGNPVDFFPGAIDDAHIYNRALTGDEVGALAGSTARWNLNEGSGGTSADNSGNGNTLTLNGPSWSASHAGGPALHFDGANDEATSRPVANTGAGYTAAAWVNLADTSGFRTAVSQDGPVASAFFLQYSRQDDRWAFAATNPGGGSSVRAVSPSAPALNTWVHLAGVHDPGARQLRLYVNGALTGTTSFAGAYATFGPTVVGRAKWGGNAVDHWAGDLDDAVVYSRALNDTEISNVYNGNPPGA